MSLLDINDVWANSTDVEWSYDTLQPPKLSVVTLHRDLKFHYRYYRMKNIPISQRLLLLGLRLMQRISYNLGWRLSARNS
ncbi:MAG: hypothetical protein IH840_10910 [Candidatus Heimdallarchaeota archaeon]|nr:hypothetical protein [Candidatus Heimdallarchaeota archaeon]